MTEGGDIPCDTNQTLSTSNPAVAVQPSTAGVDPLAPDAPILHLLSLRENPNVATMSEDELRALVQRCRTMATSPQSLSAELSKESSRANPRRQNTISAKRKAILDTL